MSNSHTVKVNAGQTLLLFKEDKILLRKKHETSHTVTTPWGSFVGTDEEVDAKIASLSLSEIVRPTTPRVEAKTVQVAVETPKPNIAVRAYNFLKSLFSK